MSEMNLGLFGSARDVDGLVADVRDAAALGYTNYWTPQIFGFDALTALAVVTREVPDIRVGTSVVPVYPRHPMALAQQALTVSQVSGGRLDLGIGLSHQPVVEGMWGLPFERPVRYMSDYLQVLMPLLAGEKVSYRGDMLTGRGEIDVPAPTPRVVVAALGAQMLKLAGRLADGTVTWMTGPTTIAELTVPTITASADAAGRATPEVIAAAPVCVVDDPTEVAALRERASKQYVVYGTLPSYRAMLDREGLAGPEDLAIIGTIDQVADGLGRYVDAGATMVVADVFGNREQRAATKAALAELTRS